MDTRDIYKLVRELSQEKDDVINLYDSMDIELSEGFVIETGVVGFTEDGVIVHLDEDAMEFLDFNGVLLESEDLKESYDESPVYSAVLNRITRQHLDLLSKFGPGAVMAAVEDLAQVHHDAEEIGSSDVSIWVKNVIQSLEAGDYKHIHEDVGGGIDEFKAKISTSDDPFELVYDAISGNHGETIRAAMQEMYDDIVIDFGLHPDDDFEQVIDKMLDYMDADSVMKENIEMNEGGHSEVDAFKSKVASSEDAFDMVYDAISGKYSEEIRAAIQEMYDDVVIDSRLHPDDDFEPIIAKIVDQLEDGYYDHPDEGQDELADIKRLAGREEVDEGLGKALLGGAALIAAITGINKMEADSMMKSEPQLVQLAQMRQEAFVQNDDEKVKELDNRIKKTMDHISVTGRPVMGIDGNPVDPRTPVGEAEYQGRKVPLGKPMQGDVKKSKVYVKNAKGNVVKVNFGDKNMTIKKNNPERRKSFRARHNCENPGPKWKARYWSCRAW
jgi:hypothetical protein